MTVCQAGYPEYELRTGGADLAVGDSNVAEYVEAVTHATLREGIQAQIGAFRSAVCVIPSCACCGNFHVFNGLSEV